jgi:CheY-like chemotaxis protein
MEAGRLTVLYVDDDHNDLALFGAAAERSDLDIWVQTASAVDQAIEILEGRGAYADRSLHPLPDVILLDLVMPAQSGFDFLQWHHDSAFESIPVIVFCGSSYEDDRQRALTLGAHFFVEKPASFDELQQVVRRLWSFGMSLRHASLAENPAGKARGGKAENRAGKSEGRRAKGEGKPKSEARRPE